MPKLAPAATGPWIVNELINTYAGYLIGNEKYRTNQPDSVFRYRTRAEERAKRRKPLLMETRTDERLRAPLQERALPGVIPSAERNLFARRLEFRFRGTPAPLSMTAHGYHG